MKNSEWKRCLFSWLRFTKNVDLPQLLLLQIQMHTHKHRRWDTNAHFQCTLLATVLTRDVTCTSMTWAWAHAEAKPPLHLPWPETMSLRGDDRNKFVSFWTKKKSCSWQLVIFTDSLLHFDKSWLSLAVLLYGTLPKLVWQVQQMCSSEVLSFL